MVSSPVLCNNHRLFCARSWNVKFLNCSNYTGCHAYNFVPYIKITTHTLLAPVLLQVHVYRSCTSGSPFTIYSYRDSGRLNLWLLHHVRLAVFFAGLDVFIQAHIISSIRNRNIVIFSKRNQSFSTERTKLYIKFSLFSSEIYHKPVC